MKERKIRMTYSNANIRGILWVSVALFCISIAACGGGNDLPPLGNVSGTVTVDGQPAPNVMVQFSPVEGGRTSSGITDGSGRYSLMYTAEASGAQVGKHEVRVAPSSQAPSDDQMDLTTPQGALSPEHLQQVFEVEVQAGNNTFDIPL
jgi:hypothetical protein